MKEKIKVLSLFASGGVAEAHLKDIGIETLVANEIKTERCKFYKYIYPKTKMIDGDITKKSIKKEIIDSSISKKINCIIRADGDFKIGHGHLKRCFALCELLQDYCNIFFFFKKNSKLY